MRQRRPLSLNKLFKDFLVNLFPLQQHQIHFSIALMSSFYSAVFWLSLYLQTFNVGSKYLGCCYKKKTCNPHLFCKQKLPV